MWRFGQTRKNNCRTTVRTFLIAIGTGFSALLESFAFDSSNHIAATSVNRPLQIVNVGPINGEPGLYVLAIRLPGTLLALALRTDVCFVEFPFVPSPEGQYLVKDFLLFGAALVIGGTIREEQSKPGVRH